MSDITKHSSFNAVDPSDFHAMVEPARYLTRDPSFDGIIAKTHDHFWDPLDPKYIDFTEPFDLDNEQIIPDSEVPELQSAVADKLDEKGKIILANETALWTMSAILHGEQGAMALSASLCHILLDPGAQEYAANQTREEARHVTAFARFIRHRWGKPYPCSTELMNLLDEIVPAKEVYKKIVGMQLIIEGLAMGAFATLYQRANDPVMRKLMQLVMTDEAFHHKFGKIWAERTVPNLTEEEHNIVEDWALKCYTNLFLGLLDAEQKQVSYEKVGLDWRWVQGALEEAATDEARRKELQETANIFRVLIKTLLQAGIITDRTRPFYEGYIDFRSLREEGERMVGEDIAEEGIAYLQSVNSAAPKSAPGTAAAE